ncbi:MAG: TadE/TadG family type IV pilus assembly protein [Planctomycetaceae bacterium]
MKTHRPLQRSRYGVGALQPSRQKSRKGTTAVEFTLVAIPFFIFLFAGIEFANMNNIRNTANNAAYEGCRKLVVPGAVAATGEAEARRIMSIVGANNLNVTVTPAVITDATREVTVRITLSFAANSILIPRWMSSANVTSEVTLATERYDGIPAP